MLPVYSKSVQHFSNAVEWKYRVEHLNGCIKDVLSARWESFLPSERKARRRDICHWYSGFCSEEKLCNLNNPMKGQVFTAATLKPKERPGGGNGSPWGTRGKIKAPRGYSSDQNVSHPSVRAGLDEGRRSLHRKLLRQLQSYNEYNVLLIFNNKRAERSSSHFRVSSEIRMNEPHSRRTLTDYYKSWPTGQTLLWLSGQKPSRFCLMFGKIT